LKDFHHSPYVRQVAASATRDLYQSPAILFTDLYNRAVSHVSALVVMSTKLAPGESPKITGVRDQRLTACLVAILVGGHLIDRF
jgi:hypothetical protein